MLLWGKIKQLGGIVTFQAYPSSKKYQEEVLQQRWKWLLIYQGHFVIRFYSMYIKVSDNFSKKRNLTVHWVYKFEDVG